VGYSGNVGNSSSFPSITAIGGAGDVFQFNEEASEDRYTYYAVDNATGMIVMVDDEGDFFDLIPGKYTIHGVSYKDSGPTPPSNLDPSFWVGQMPSDIFREEDCQKPSRNSRYVEIKTTCRILDIEEVSRTACEVGISTFDLTLSVTHKLSPDQGDLVVNGFSFPVEASPQTVVLTDQFANGQEIPIQAFFTEVPSCRFLTELFITAPENCCGIALNLGEDKQVCIGEEEIILNAGDDGVSYEWTRDGENLNIALGQNNLDVLDVPGLYRVLVKNEFDCPAEDSIKIEVTPFPEIFVSEDETICDDEFFIIN